MKCSLNTFYKNQDEHGNSISCLEFSMETARVEFRDAVYDAIRLGLAEVKEADVEEKSSQLGFHMDENAEQE